MILMTAGDASGGVAVGCVGVAVALWEVAVSLVGAAMASVRSCWLLVLA